MNYITHLQSLHQGSELLSSISFQHHATTVGPPRPPLVNFDQGCTNEGGGKKNKKMNHRDVERQRRQEMASLYADLRSLLPLQHVKGKRSISDHMDEATNYIKMLQKKIKELNHKRDELKRISNSTICDIKRRKCSSSVPNYVTVRESCLGVEVTISSVQPLSKVLQVLVEQELTVMSCVSTNVNQMSLYTIQSQASDLKSEDLSGLHQKLIGLF